MPRPRHVPTALALALALALGPPAGAEGTLAAAPGDAATGASANASEAPLRLDTIVVVASRAPEPLAQVASSVTVVDRAQIEQRLAQDSADLVRYVPGVRMDADADRFGARGFSIRGLGGNRVRVEIDGVPLPDAFAVGQFASAGRDLLDLEAVEQVEILRGPASTLYGSDALAGIVALRTRDPEALLAEAQAARAFGLRGAFSSRDDSRLLSGQWAGEGGTGWQGMALLSQRRGHETGNRAWRIEDAPNPTDARSDAFLGKLARDAGPLGRWTLVAEHAAQRREVDVVSQRFAPGRLATTYRLLADDRSRRDRLSLGAGWDAPRAGLERVDALIYGQHSRVRQDTAQFRLPDRATPFESLRQRRFEFAQRDLGLDLVAQSRFEAAGARHWLVYGLELARTRYEGVRDGVEVNLATGASSPVILGERMPVRDFPHSVATRAALFVQDEVGLGRWALVPALRWERYRLDARPDALFVEDYPDIATVDVGSTSLTPRLGLRFAATPRSHLFAQYAEGFRAPPFGDVNIGLFLPAFNYEVRANPALRPERSRGLEAGWRWQGEAVQASVSAYANRYRDLIESRANLGVDPDSGALVFQSVNRDRARIRGVELEAGWDLGATAAALDGWRLRAAAAWARGEDSDSGRPLNGVEPASLVLGLAWTARDGRWGTELIGSGKRRMTRVDERAGALFVPGGHAVFDAYLWAEPRPGLRLNLGVQNLADRRYWDFAALNGLPANAANAGFHTRPGRSVAASLGLAW